MLGEGGEYLIEGICVAFFRCIAGFWDESIDWEMISDHLAQARKTSSSNSMLDDFTKIKRCWNLEFADESLKQWICVCRARLFAASSNFFLDSDDNDDGGPTIVDELTVLNRYEANMVESLLVVVRNLSFVSANARFMVHSADLLRLLIGCLNAVSPAHSLISSVGTAINPIDANSNLSSTTTSNNGGNCKQYCLHAIHTLINLAQLVDVTGRKLFADLTLMDRSDTTSSTNKDIKSLLPPSSCGDLGLGGWFVARRFDIKEESISKIPDEAIYSVCHAHIQSAAVIFPLLARIVTESFCNRGIIIATLELLKDLSENVENVDIFVNVQDSFLKRLVELLWVPRLGPDSLDYIDPINNIVTRVTTLKLTGGYDALIDFEVRDRSMELLEKLSGLSADIKRKLGAIFPDVYDYLMQILTTTVGRNDAPQVAGKILVNLAAVPENRPALMYIQSKLLVLAAKDANVANIACNSILNQLC